MLLLAVNPWSALGSQRFGNVMGRSRSYLDLWGVLAAERRSPTLFHATGGDWKDQPLTSDSTTLVFLTDNKR